MRHSLHAHGRASRIGIFGAILLSSVFAGSSASAAGPFSYLKGSWSGGGSFKLENGHSEKIRCRAYYNPKSGGAKVGMAIRCASKGSKFELRASLIKSGGSVSGTWEERTFNAGGSLSGSASKRSLRLRMNGSLQGSVKISTSGRKQFVSISTSGPGLKSVTISLRKR